MLLTHSLAARVSVNKLSLFEVYLEAMPSTIVVVVFSTSHTTEWGTEVLFI